MSHQQPPEDEPVSSERVSSLHAFRVPERHERALRDLGELSEDAYQRLARALDHRPPVVDSDALTALVRDELKDDLTVRRIRTLVDALLSIESTRATHAISPDRICGDLAATLDRAVGEMDRELIARRVAGCLGRASLSVTAKVLDLFYADANTHHTARIITAIRPVWIDDPEERPIGSVLVHVLELSYYQDDGALRSFYVALDDDDLATLSRVVDRAKLKGATLRSFLEQAGLKAAEPVDAPEED